MTCFQQSDLKTNFRRWSGILNHCDYTIIHGTFSYSIKICGDSTTDLCYYLYGKKGQKIDSFKKDILHMGWIAPPWRAYFLPTCRHIQHNLTILLLFTKERNKKQALFTIVYGTFSYYKDLRRQHNRTLVLFVWRKEVDSSAFWKGYSTLDLYRVV